MGTPAYAATQLLQTATLTYRNASETTESLGTQFPASNVADSRVGTVAKFPRVELGSIVWQWSTTKTWNTVAWLNHNCASDLVLKVQKSSDGVSWTDVATGISLTSNRYWTSFSDQSSLWGRVLLTALGSQAAIPYFGEVWVGDREVLTRNHAWGVRTGRANNGVVTRTTWGIPQRYQKNGYDRVTGVMADALTEAERDQIAALFEAVKGSGQPFLWIPNSDTATECWVAELENDEWEVAENAVSRFDALMLGVREIPHGRPVA